MSIKSRRNILLYKDREPCLRRFFRGIDFLRSGHSRSRKLEIKLNTLSVYSWKKSSECGVYSSAISVVDRCSEIVPSFHLHSSILLMKLNKNELSKIQLHKRVTECVKLLHVLEEINMGQCAPAAKKQMGCKIILGQSFDWTQFKVFYLYFTSLLDRNHNRVSVLLF